MKINLNFRSNKYTLEVEKDDTIGSARDKFFEMIKDKNEDVNINDIKFVGRAKFLDFSKTFAEEGIKTETSILVHKTLPKKDKKPAETKEKPESNTGSNAPPLYTNMNVPPMDAFGAGNVNPSMISNQMNILLNDPDTLDLTIKTIMPNASDNERELYKKAFIDNCKKFKDNPELLKQMTNQMQGAMGNMNNVGNPYMPPASPAVNPYSSPVMPGYGVPPYNSYYGNPYMHMHHPYVVPSPTIPCCHGFYPPNYNEMSPQAHTPQTDTNAENKFKEQLKILNEMGYTNKQLNVHALTLANGDISEAVAHLVRWSSGKGSG